MFGITLNEVVLFIAFASLISSMYMLAQVGVKAAAVERVVLCVLGAMLIRLASDSFVALMIIEAIIGIMVMKTRNGEVAKAFGPLQRGIALIALIGVITGAFPLGFKTDAIINMSSLLIVILLMLVARATGKKQQSTYRFNAAQLKRRTKAKKPKREKPTPANNSPSESSDGEERDKLSNEPWVIIAAVGGFALILMIVVWGFLEMSLILPRP